MVSDSSDESNSSVESTDDTEMSQDRILSTFFSLEPQWLDPPMDVEEKPGSSGKATEERGERGRQPPASLPKREGIKGEREREAGSEDKEGERARGLTNKAQTKWQEINHQVRSY
ncbi:hypothetical protein E2562_021557 [Oryza meyeriana var. granulata]|uniref:Uncharacterized protein n=1 Tax=Oryza meyeriana var. granulata TaxID=110450 RepID=A0A6G1EXT8_9ORYZ|nr:hypothetical protein E2562_021557 [Oryza meyeriana var. granulata]